MTRYKLSSTILLKALTVSTFVATQLFGPITQLSNASEETDNKPVSAQTPVDSVSAPADGLVKQADDAFWSRDYVAARNLVQKYLESTKLSQAERARGLVNVSICDAQMDDWEQADKNSLASIKLAEVHSRTIADAQMIQARCLLLSNRVEKARVLYENAIALLTQLDGAWNPDLAPFYEGLAGCSVRQKKFVEAEEEYKKVAQFDFLKYGADDTHFAWSLMSLGQVEKILDKESLADEFFKKLFWNFRKQNELRILGEHSDAKDQKALRATLIKQLYGETGAYNNGSLGLDYIKTGIPEKVLADSTKNTGRPRIFANWYKERIGRERAPGLAFLDPTRDFKGLIISVHGLGLYGAAFASFGEQIQHQGFGLLAFDVRGFGSYRNDEIYQKLDLQAAVADIKHILTEMRVDHPKTPIILLGESMGGAIVLRIASESPALVDAVISSVPSGSRYQGKKTALKVGLKFLNHKDRQFDIGTEVVRQATSDADLRDMWEGDSQMRMKLSPVELMNFQNFMSENVKAAQKIKHTPVIIYQGFSDNLVKPMGTLAIYQAIPNKDKDMVFLGRAQHLIFEENQFDVTILNNVVEWITRHTASKNSVN